MSETTGWSGHEPEMTWTGAAAHAAMEQERDTLARIRAHTGLPPLPSQELLVGLLNHIAEIVDARLAVIRALKRGDQ